MLMKNSASSHQVIFMTRIFVKYIISDARNVFSVPVVHEMPADQVQEIA